MNLAALFITAQSLKQPKYLTTDEQKDKLWDNQIMKYSLVIKRETAQSTDRHNTDESQNLMVNEGSQILKTTHCMISLL